MNKAKIIVGVTGILAGLTAYQVYQASTLWNAIIVLFFIAVLVQMTNSWGALWDFLVNAKQPHFLALIMLIAGFSYISLTGAGFWASNIFSTGTALIGFAIGILIYGLWNLR